MEVEQGRVEVEEYSGCVWRLLAEGDQRGSGRGAGGASHREGGLERAERCRHCLGEMKAAGPGGLCGRDQFGDREVER